MSDRESKRAGWYTDPLGHADLRWWDSTNWTEQVKSARPTSPPLQWADEFDRLLEPDTSAVRQAPPPTLPVADPQFALHATPEVPAAQPAAAGPDWSELAFVLRTVGDDIVSVTATALPELTIDMAQTTYWWAYELDSFPAHPVDLRIKETPRREAVLPGFAGRHIEPLLWRIGNGSSAASTLTLVDTSSRYKLRRWPNLTGMPHTAEQSKLTTLLANAQLTPVELAAVAEVSQRDVKALISTYALMSLLDVVEDPAAAAKRRVPPPPASPPPASPPPASPPPAN